MPLEDEFRFQFLYWYRGNCIFNTMGQTSFPPCVFLSEHLYFSFQQGNRWVHPVITGHYLISAWDSLPLQSMGSSLLPFTKNFTVGKAWIWNSFLKSCWCVTSILPNWILGASFLSCRAASANSSDKFWEDWDKVTSGKGQSKANGLHKPQCEAF